MSNAITAVRDVGPELNAIERFFARLGFLLIIGVLGSAAIFVLVPPSTEGLTAAERSAGAQYVLPFVLSVIWAVILIVTVTVVMKFQTVRGRM